MPSEKTLEQYLADLDKGKADRPEQVRLGIEEYIGLWRQAIALGVVSPADSVSSALEKVEGHGGLYKAAEG